MQGKITNSKDAARVYIQANWPADNSLEVLRECKTLLGQITNYEHAYDLLDRAIEMATEDNLRDVLWEVKDWIGKLTFPDYDNLYLKMTYKVSGKDFGECVEIFESNSSEKALIGKYVTEVSDNTQSHENGHG